MIMAFRPASNLVQFAHPCEGHPAKQEPVVTLMDGDTGALPPRGGAERTVHPRHHHQGPDSGRVPWQPSHVHCPPSGSRRQSPLLFRSRRRGGIRADRRSPTLEGVARDPGGAKSAEHRSRVPNSGLGRCRAVVSLSARRQEILLGHANSEEAGMEYCARSLKTFITEVAIEFLPAGDPFGTPR